MTMKNRRQKKILPPIKIKTNFGLDLSFFPIIFVNKTELNPEDKAYIVLTLLVSFSSASV